MFHRKKDDGAAHQLLSRDGAMNEELPHEVIWDQASSASERNISNDTDIWEHDPIQGEGESHNLEEMPTSERQASAHQSGRRTRTIQPEDYREAATELDEEFQKIFSPVRPPTHSTVDSRKTSATNMTQR